MRPHLVLVSLASLAAAACATRPTPVAAPVEVRATAEAPPAPAPAAAPLPVAEPAVVAAPAPLSADALQRELAAAAGEDRVYFAFDSSALSSEAQATLRAQAAWLAARPAVRVQIAGNADERGTREYNLALGARRAAAVKEYLIAQGIAPDRIATLSNGKERPIDPRSTEEGWARNRNAHTGIVTISAVS